MLEVLYGRENVDYVVHNHPKSKCKDTSCFHTINYSLINSSRPIAAYLELRFIPDADAKRCLLDADPAGKSSSPDIVYMNYGAWQADGPSKFDEFRETTKVFADDVKTYLELHPKARVIWATTHPFSSRLYHTRVRTNERIEIMNFISSYTLMQKLHGYYSHNQSSRFDIFDAYNFMYPRLDVAACDAGSHYHCLGERKVGYEELALLWYVLNQT
jgi:hypothetical protein